MRKSISCVGLLAVFFSMTVVSVPVTAADKLPKFQLRKLGTLGQEASVGTAINNGGQATGYVGEGSGPRGFPPQLRHPMSFTGGRAFLYSDGKMTDLGTLGGLYSI